MTGEEIENFAKLETPYFTAEKISVESEYKYKVDSDFHSYTVINGNGKVISGDQILDLEKRKRYTYKRMWIIV